GFRNPGKLAMLGLARGPSVALGVPPLRTRRTGTALAFGPEVCRPRRKSPSLRAEDDSSHRDGTRPTSTDREVVCLTRTTGHHRGLAAMGRPAIHDDTWRCRPSVRFVDLLLSLAVEIVASLAVGRARFNETNGKAARVKFIARCQTSTVPRGGTNELCQAERV